MSVEAPVSRREALRGDMETRPRKGKHLAMITFFVALGVAGFTLKPFLLEELYLLKLDSVDPATRELAAEKLAQMRSVRAVPRLMDRFREEAQQNYAPY